MNKQLIFGSTALKHWLPDLKRTPKDLDIMGTGASTSKVEYHFNPAFNYILEHNKDATYVDLNLLYTIKCSHLHYDINWDKHCIDIMFMQSKGCQLDDTLYDLLMKDWEQIHGKKRVNLNQSKDTFFTPYVKRLIDHDTLHEMLAYKGIPIYKSILKDGKEVLTDIHKWNMLSHEDKLLCILEEVYVTAFERWSNLPPQISKMKAMKLYCTSLAKNDYFKYAVVNMKELYEHESNAYFISKIKEIQNDYITRD